MTTANVAQLGYRNNSASSSRASSGPPQLLGASRDTSPALPNRSSTTNTRTAAVGSTRSSSFRSSTTSSYRRDDDSDASGLRPRGDIRVAHHRDSDNRLREATHRMAIGDRECSHRDMRELSRAPLNLRDHLYSTPPNPFDAVLEESQPQFPLEDADRWREPLVSDQGFASEEENRRCRAISRQANQRTVILPIRPTDASLVGPWHNTTIRMLNQAENLEHWMLSGCPYTIEYYRWLHRSFSGDPTARRSEGEAYLLARQQHILEGVAIRQEWLDSQGQSTTEPPSLANRLSDGPVATSSPSCGISSRARAQLDDTIRDTQRPPSPRFQGPSYLGLSPPSPGPTRAVDITDGPTDRNTNVHQSTHTDRTTVFCHYQYRPASAWPIGMRDSLGDYPSTHNAVPLLNDVLAHNTIMTLAPNRLEDLELHEYFITMTMQVFSIRGYYHRMVSLGGWIAGAYPLDQFPFRRAWMNHSTVAAWYHGHGILPDSVELPMIEAYAASTRRQMEGSRLPLSEPYTFTNGFPCTSEDVLRVTEGSIVQWQDLDFGETRPGITTGYPSRPSTAGDIDVGASEAPAAANDDEVSLGNTDDAGTPMIE
ncbi:hypothetical protein C8J57DRAFT_1524233 [Mycena rebaudengoi]|nr:hypothetical protein C8J57DRAFT_1524233 [Mycena rebaudengoi]